MSRKLATIAKVGELLPIKDADLIELAVLDGRAWKCIVKKGEFKVGDFGVYFEPDSFLPKKEPFLFLEGRCNKKLNGEEGYRLKTIRMKGQISQGLLLPVSMFNNFTEFVNFIKDKEIADLLNEDVTELLEVKLYEPFDNGNARLQGEKKADFPYFCPKTDQERLENLLEYFDIMKGVSFQAELKADGSSCTVYYNNNEFGVCSRNLELKPSDDNTYWKTVRKFDIEKDLSEFQKNIALQMELVGEKIQCNRMKIEGHELFLYDIFDIDEQKYLLPADRKRIFDKIGLKVKYIPVIEESIKIFDVFKNFDELHEWVTMQKGYNNTLIEGVVFKSLEYINGKIISFKVINKKYLLKHGI